MWGPAAGAPRSRYDFRWSARRSRPLMPVPLQFLLLTRENFERLEHEREHETERTGNSFSINVRAETRAPPAELAVLCAGGIQLAFKAHPFRLQPAIERPALHV